MPELAAALYAGLVGLTVAGFAGSSWALVTGSPPALPLLLNRNLLFPVAFLVLLFHVPVMLCAIAFAHVRAQPARSAVMLVAAMLWSFIQGVFILTQLFGVR